MELGIYTGFAVLVAVLGSPVLVNIPVWLQVVSGIAVFAVFSPLSKIMAVAYKKAKEVSK